MYLKSLALRGFKSFASATTLNFEPGITAIVGPNGSGKSNVVDALAWVMGEQGAKSLRGGKMEDVIFAGTAGRAPLGRAEVTLTIDNTDGALPLEFTEVTISRMLFRSGGSEYAINGQTVRLLDVQELLSDTGMGREMHVIVGQGQLDQILQATPEARRGFIEEAAGVLKHRRRKEKAVRKLESTQANLARLNDLTGEIRRQLKPLGRQAEVARKAATVQAELRDARARLLADDITQARLALESDRATELTLRAQHQAGEAELATARKAEAAAEQAVDDLRPLLAAAQEDWYALAALAERVTSTQQVAAERIRHGNEQPPTSNGRDPDALDREADKVRAEEVQLVDQVRLAAAALTEASSRRDEAESAEASAARSYASQLRAVADRREGLARLTGQVDSLRSRLEAGSEEEARLRARLTEAVARAEDAERQFTQLETRLTGVTDGESDLDTGYERAAEAQAAAESELERLRAAERAAEQRSATLRARIEALQVGLKRRDASGALLNDGELPGLLGSLASMVSIEPEWQTAVSAALGAATEALAVCDLSVALGVFERLKSGDLGRAGMLLGDAPDDGDPWPALPSGERWAIDVVKADSALRPGLRRLLRCVAVVDDITAAQSLVTALPEVTAVTAGGDLLSSWFVAGGSDAQPSVIEVQAAMDEAAEALAAAGHDVGRVRFAIATAGQRLREAAQVTAIALERLHDSDAQMSALAEQLGTLAQSGRGARAEAARLEQAMAQSSGKRASDRAALVELTARLEAASQDTELVEPDPGERDRLSVPARLARNAEMDARLGLRTLEERARSLAGRADSLTRAAQHERQARAKAEARVRQLRREARAAAAVHRAAVWLAERVRLAQSAAAEERNAVEEGRRRAEASLGHLRAVAREKARQLDAIVEGEHRDQMTRVELTMRLEQLNQRAMTELALEVDVLVDEYGPDQLVPALTAVGSNQSADDDAMPAPVPYVREQQAARLRTAQRNLETLGRVNPLALEEFEAMSERHAFLARQLDDLKQTRKDLLDIIDEVDNRVQEVFASAFVDIQVTFSDVFARLFPGGEGRLVLTDPDDMLATGVDVEARPAGKKVKRLSLLSGGERSLVAVAFLISLFIARPSPFYILDEVEAALDDVNLGRLLTIYEELRVNSQLLIITHQKRTMEVADALYGVTMRDDGVSTVISQRLKERVTSH